MTVLNKIRQILSLPQSEYLSIETAVYRRCEGLRLALLALRKHGHEEDVQRIIRLQETGKLEE